MYHLPESKTSSNYLAPPRRDRISDGQNILANCTVNASQLKNGWQLGDARNQRSPNFSPINLRTLPEFVYRQHMQGSNQVQNTRLNRNSENDRAQVSQNRNPQETQNGLRAPLEIHM